MAHSLAVLFWPECSDWLGLCSCIILAWNQTELHRLFGNIELEIILFKYYDQISRTFVKINTLDIGLCYDICTSMSISQNI